MLNIEIQDRFLENARPETVYGWLEENARKLWRWSCNSEEKNVELMLLHRSDPIIDLALALFSWNSEIRIRLYDKGDPVLQKAVLTNKQCGSIPALEGLLQAENIEYLEILLKNTEDRLFLVELFKKEGSFYEVKKTYWLSLLKMTAINKILEYPYSEDDPRWDDDDIGIEAYATRLYRSVYGLFDMLNVNEKNVKLLTCLIKKLPDIHPFHLADLDVPKMMKKWKNKKSIQHSDYLYFYEHKNDWDTTLDKRFTKIETKCFTELNYVTCRTHLANSFHGVSNEFKESEDIALRMAYYRNKNFNWNEEGSNELLDNWKKYITKDSYLFIENIIKNFSIYWNKEIREFIGEGFVLDRTYYADEYLERLKKLQNNNPEKFVDNLQIENIESELYSLRNDVHSISLKTEENKRAILSQGTRAIRSQGTASFVIIFLLVVIILLL